MAFAGRPWIVFTVVLSPEGKTVAWASWGKTAKLWDLATGKEVGTQYKDAIQHLTEAIRLRPKDAVIPPNACRPGPARGHPQDSPNRLPNSLVGQAWVSP
jgi:WD40 repeat protein